MKILVCVLIFVHWMWSPAADLCGRPLCGVRSRSPARQLARAACVALERKVWKQVLIPTPDMPLFRVDFQAARHLISALDRLAALSGSTKTADGAGDGRRGVRGAFAARCRDGEQSGHSSYPWESALKWLSHTKGAAKASGTGVGTAGGGGLAGIVAAPSLLTTSQSPASCMVLISMIVTWGCVGGERERERDFCQYNVNYFFC